MTPELLSAATGVTSDTAKGWLAPLTAATDKYGISLPMRLAAFLSQVAFESGGFQHLSENLNYSAERLLQVFPTHFDAKLAAAYAFQPVKIASRVYANRQGNGDEASQDGWKYHGQGLIQLTFKGNYAAAAGPLGLPLVAQPGLLTEPGPAAMSAAWYWNKNSLNAAADKGQIIQISNVVNTGSPTKRANGLDGRVALYQKALAAFGLPAWKAATV
jgi:putative chitinase